MLEHWSADCKPRTRSVLFFSGFHDVFGLFLKLNKLAMFLQSLPRYINQKLTNEGNKVMDKRISRKRRKAEKIFWWIKEETSLFQFGLSIIRLLMYSQWDVERLFMWPLRANLTAVNLCRHQTIQFRCRRDHAQNWN